MIHVEDPIRFEDPEALSEELDPLGSLVLDTHRREDPRQPSLVDTDVLEHTRGEDDVEHVVIYREAEGVPQKEERVGNIGMLTPELVPLGEMIGAEGPEASFAEQLDGNGVAATEVEDLHPPPFSMTLATELLEERQIEVLDAMDRPADLVGE